MLDEDQRAVAEPDAESTHADEDKAFQGGGENNRTQEEPAKSDSEGEGSKTQAEPREGEEGEAEKKPEQDRAKPPAWLQKQIDRERGRTLEERRRADALQAELEALRGNAEPEAVATQGEAERQVRKQSPELSQEQVRAEAQRIVKEQKFNDTCNAAFDAGKGKFPDFEQTVGEFRNLGGLQPDFLEDVLEAGNAHETLYHLGRNLDEADRIMSMQPRQRMAALARLSDKLSAPPVPKPISRVPAPVDPVGGAGRPSALNTDPDSLSTAEWMRRRNAGEIR